MSEQIVALLIGTVIGLAIGGVGGFSAGIIFEAWRRGRSRYAKMEAEFDKKAEEIRKSIDASRKRFEHL